MIKNILPGLACALLLLSCGNNEIQKKVLIMGKGDLQVNDKNINMTKGSGYADKEVDVREPGAVTFVAETEKGKQNVNIPAENGYYVLNLKTDTICGSIQVFGKDISNSKVITQEELRIKIDSLEQMVVGKNINFKTNFMILPNEVKKVSGSIQAQVFGPYRKIPATLSVNDDNKDPEIYKFYTNTEVRELIVKLKKLTY